MNLGNYIYIKLTGLEPFPVLRLRTVNAGEWASLSIVNRTTVLWFFVMVAPLILSGSTFLPRFVYIAPRPGGVKEPRGYVPGPLI